MNTTTSTENPPLTRAHVEELLQKNGGANDLQLAEANLEGADLSNLVLRGVILRGANLKGADLSNANLVEADLRETNLSNANLSKADLSDADLSNANLNNTVFKEVNISNARIDSANLFHIYFSSGDLIHPNTIIGSPLPARRFPRPGTKSPDAFIREASRHDTENERSGEQTELVLPPQSERIGEYIEKAIQALYDDPNAKAPEKNLPAKTAVEEGTFVFGIRLVEEPLTPYHLATVLMTITELSTKCWLIAMNRFADLIEYTQAHDERFVKETRLRFTAITYNSPFQGNFDIQLNATNLAEGIVTAVDGAIQVKQRLNKVELENWEKAQKLSQELDKADQERKRAQLELEHEKITIEREQLELERQKLNIERERLQTMELRLDVQKKGIEYALDIATKTVTVLQPQADDERKGMLIQTLLPTILRLQNEDHLELVLPSLPPNKNEDETKQQNE